MTDIFDFWSQCPRGAFAHPADVAVLNRVAHSFELDCLPAPFTGALRTAKIVLLFLSPGLDSEGFDARHAASDAGKDWYHRQLTGLEPMPSPQDHPPHYKWWTQTVKQLGIDLRTAAQQIAVLDLAPYHSTKFNDARLLGALPSCRASVDWAQRILFPQAIEGKRMVICLRSHSYWGLRKGAVEGLALFSPDANQRGYMTHGQMRERVIQSARYLCQ